MSDSSGYGGTGGGGGYGGGGGKYGPVHTLYASSIHEAIDSGDAARQREVEQAAQQTIDQIDEIRAAHAKLKEHLGRSNS
jgi:hypothetical protein